MAHGARFVECYGRDIIVFSELGDFLSVIHAYGKSVLGGIIQAIKPEREFDAISGCERLFLGRVVDVFLDGYREKYGEIPRSGISGADVLYREFNRRPVIRPD